jgi:5-methylcytosine-specific restriction endonuclease McrA
MISDTQYRTQEWLTKRKVILARDNFTCQTCGTFNPSEGWVTVYNKKDNDLEIHNYDSNTCEYYLSSQKSGITLNIDYGWGIWLVTPILQIHHKKYIQGKKLWEYESDDLITLCNKCHNEVHIRNKIPIFDINSNFIENRLFTPEDNNVGRSHKFNPWVFINNYSGEYKVSTVHPSISFFVLAEDINRIEELEITAKNMYNSFMERFLPDYYKDDK